MTKPDSPHSTAQPPILHPPDPFREWTREEIFPARPDAPLEIDLGCGDGGFLLAMAARFPERNFLATERLLGRVRLVAKNIARAGLSNARVLRLESAHTLGWCLPTAGVSRLHLLFPDPWPKAKHNERRLVRHPDFARGMDRAFEPGGEFRFKSDDAELFEEVAAFLPEQPGWTPAPWPEEEFYAETDFERLWLSAGRTIQSTRWIRTPGA